MQYHNILVHAERWYTPYTLCISIKLLFFIPYFTKGIATIKQCKKMYIHIGIGYSPLLFQTHFDIACNPVLYFSNYQSILTFFTILNGLYFNNFRFCFQCLEKKNCSLENLYMLAYEKKNIWRFLAK